jgi:intron-binding protein aquarius
VITHSNHALNDIFEKISNLDIDEKHLLRLGVGEKELKLKKEYSRQGRINFMLQRRMELLSAAQKLQRCLGHPFAEEFTCETAELFLNLVVKHKWIDPAFGDKFEEFIREAPEVFSEEKRKFYE